MGVKTTNSGVASKRKTQRVSKPRKSSPSTNSHQHHVDEYEFTDVSPDERNRMIAEAAYYRAEQHGFNPEDQVQHWLDAEKEVDAMLKNVTHQVDKETTH
jgi:hypothetical protein